MSVAGIFMSVGAGTAAGAVINDTWQGGPGNWSDAAKWNNGVPNNAGSTTYNVFIDNGNATTASTTTLDMNAAVDFLGIDANDRLIVSNGNVLSVSKSISVIGPGDIRWSLDINGRLTLNSSGSPTDLLLPENANYKTLGGGEIRMTEAHARILGSSTGSTTATLTNNTPISGAGQIGVNRLNLDNRAAITANLPGQILTIDTNNPSLSYNSGQMAALGGGELAIRDSQIVNASGGTDGLIKAGNGSTVRIKDLSIITGGKFETAAGPNPGTLILRDAIIEGGASITNAGVIRAYPGSTSADVQIKNSALDNSGEFFIGNAANTVFDGLTSFSNSGVLRLNSTKMGQVFDPNTTLRVTTPLTLTGGGELALSQSDNNRVMGGIVNQDNLIHGAGRIDPLIANYGTIDADQPLFNGVVIHTYPSAPPIYEPLRGGTLEVRADGSTVTGIVNGGTMKATQGRLRIVGDVQNFKSALPFPGSTPTPGTIAADNAAVEIKSMAMGTTLSGKVHGGTVQVIGNGSISLGAHTGIVGGTLTNSATGRISTSGDVVIGGKVTNPAGGQITVESLSHLRLLGGGSNSYINNGTIEFKSPWSLPLGQRTQLIVDGGTVTLNGGGNVVMSFLSEILGAGGASDRLVNYNTISGRGFIGKNNMGLRNLGAIDADSAFNPLTIDVAGTAFANEGTLRASGGGGGLKLDDALFVNSGAVEILAGSALTAADVYRQTAGSTTLSGGSLAATTIDIQGGTFGGNGGITGAVSFGPGATLGPGASPGILDFLGDASFAGTINIEIAGLLVDSGVPDATFVNTATDPSTTQFDQINTFGQATLVGGLTLDVSLLGGFDPTVGSVFDVMTADLFAGALSGVNFLFPTLTGDRAFTAALIGAPDRLGTGDRQALRLTVVSTAPPPPPPVTKAPEPGALTLFGVGLIGLAFARRRRAS